MYYFDIKNMEIDQYRRIWFTLRIYSIQAFNSKRQIV